MTYHYVLVTGSRDYPDQLRVITEVQRALMHNGVLIEGEADGPDSWAAAIAVHQRHPVKRMPADWQRHKKKAGPLRNQEMVDLLVLRRSQGFRCEVLAFPVDGVKDESGTWDCIVRALKAGFPVNIHKQGAPLEVREPLAQASLI